jgi:hypothetical protein
LSNDILKIRKPVFPENECHSNCIVPFEERPCIRKPIKPDNVGNIDLYSKGLIHTSLEIGKAIAARGRLTMKAAGTCMYPNVRQGDYLLIAPASADELTAGDIAICRKPSYMFAHRVVDKGRDEEGRPYIITRADRNQTGNDGKTYDENLLGRVARIERKGELVPIASQEYSLAERLFHEAVLNIKLFMNELKFGLAGTVQDMCLYKSLGRIWWMFATGHAEYSVHIPLNPGNSRLFEKKIRIDDFDGEYIQLQGGKHIDIWKLVMSLKGQIHPAASLKLIRSPEGCVKAGWWVDDMQIRLRYRGTSIEKALIEKVEGILKNYGMNLFRRREKT